ncbi:DUF1707 SHOCT-like domain-containing protein [Spirillospora sp. CA-294931]|uniref:DUF1707 SHOCT-like domain-containing protein n=1 Tax=Spirillospora sp. CA-294931 TaxID=3240042 RepID=UPI003D940818
MCLVNAPEPSPEPVPPGAMRASDADRDRVADLLREALTEGRISPEEHSERIDAVYAAKTYADLAPVLADLPGASTPDGERVQLRKEELRDDLPAPVAQSTNLVAIMSGAERKGRWLVEPTTTITCLMGGVELDFRQAVLSQREVTVTITCVMGGVEMTVPRGVRVVNSVTCVMGGVQLPEDDGAFDLDGPVIRLTGLALMGGVDVKRADPGTTRADRREARRALHQERREVHRRFHDERRDRLRELRQSRRRHGA